MRRFWFTFCFLSLILSTRPARPAEMFRISEIVFQGKVLCSHIEDVNADRRRDILLVLEDQNQDVRFYLYLQKAHGFERKPQQVFQLPADAILFDLGNVNNDAFKELVFFKPDGVFYYPFADSAFTLAEQRLVQTRSIFQRANPNSMVKWDFVADVNGDRLDDIFVPGVNASTIYLHEKDSTAWQPNAIRLLPEARLVSRQPSRFSLGSRVISAFTMPYVFWEDFDADGRRDLIAVYEDSLLAFCQTDTGSFEYLCRQKIPLDFGPLWSGAKIHRNRIGAKRLRKYLMKVKDLNGDGRLDVVTTRISTEKSFINPENEVLIYYGRSDSSTPGKIYFPEKPDQRIRPGGTQLVIDIVDLNLDGRYDVIIPVVKVGLHNIIRMMLTKSVEIQAETYLMHDNGRFAKNPDLKNKMLVKFTYRGGATSPVYEINDFNGDGLQDVLTSAEQKKLAFFWGDRKHVLRSKIGDVFYVPLPQNGELVSSMDMNDDGKCDILINYGEETAPADSSLMRVLIAN